MLFCRFPDWLGRGDGGALGTGIAAFDANDIAVELELFPPGCVLLACCFARKSLNTDNS